MWGGPGKNTAVWERVSSVQVEKEMVHMLVGLFYKQEWNAKIPSWFKNKQTIKVSP